MSLLSSILEMPKVERKNRLVIARARKGVRGGACGCKRKRAPSDRTVLTAGSGAGHTDMDTC